MTHLDPFSFGSTESLKNLLKSEKQTIKKEELVKELKNEQNRSRENSVTENGN
jgi:hypothetical protein